MPDDEEASGLGRRRRRSALARRWAEADPAFRSHLHAVSAETMARWPALWGFPVTFARSLERHVPLDADRDHLVQLATHILHVRLESATRTAADRVRRCVGRRMAGLVTALSRLGGGTTGAYRALLPRGVTAEGLRGLVTRIARTEEDRREWLHFLHGAVDGAVFAPTVPPGTRLWPPRARGSGDRSLRRRPRAPRQAIRPTDVAALRAACQTQREAAMLSVLSTTGLRREAVARLRLADVWDTVGGAVHRDGLRAVEKFGSVRTIRPVPTALRTALERYLRSPTESPLLLLASGSSTPVQPLLLFPPPPGSQRAGAYDAGRPCPSAVTTTVQRLCRRAGIHPPFRPHQFRSFVADEVLNRGGTVAEAARHLGHRSPDVTFRCYVTAPDRGRIPMLEPCDGGGEGGPAAALTEEWDLLQSARMALEAQVAALRGDQGETV